VVELSLGDVTSGLARLLAAEIEKPPLCDPRKISHLTCERYTIDAEHETVVALSFGDVSSGFKRPLADEIAILP
jgi:hypothetical protein